MRVHDGQEEGTQNSDARRDALIESLAQRIEAMGLATPAILMLEAHKPLSFLGSQAILIAQPLLNVAFNPTASQEVADLLEDRSNVERLIERLERRENDRAGSSA
jgi:hypothetical protein